MQRSFMHLEETPCKELPNAQSSPQVDPCEGEARRQDHFQNKLAHSLIGSTHRIHVTSF